jgi:hypothetical protein
MKAYVDWYHFSALLDGRAAFKVPCKSEKSVNLYEERVRQLQKFISFM